MKMSLNQRYFLGAAAVILAVFVGIVVAYPHLPATIPIHWNAHGEVNGWGPKWSLFIWGPGMMILLTGIFAALPWLSPKKFEVDSFRATYLYIMIATLAMLAYIQVLVLLAGLGAAPDVGRAVEGGISVLIALIGNVLGKVRRNFYVGIRTPWTIANERVWNATHRLGAKTFFIGGLIGLLAVLLHAWFWIPMSAIFAAALIPVIYSLVFYKRLEHRGELNGQSI